MLFDANTLMGVFDALTIAVLVAGMVYLVVLSALVHDTYFITTHPLAFVFEMAAMFAIPGLPVLLFISSQGAKPSLAIKYYISIGIKFAVFHVLFHVSGMYRRLFMLDYPMR